MISSPWSADRLANSQHRTDPARVEEKTLLGLDHPPVQRDRFGAASGGNPGGERRMTPDSAKNNGRRSRRPWSEGVAVHALGIHRSDGAGAAHRLRSRVRDVPALITLVLDVRGHAALYGLRSPGVGEVMTISTGDCLELPVPLINYHRNLLMAHADDLVTQVCPICRVHQCEDWRAARKWLSAADELTVPQERWLSIARLDLKQQP